jgi:hypothetical protein
VYGSEINTIEELMAQEITDVGCADPELGLNNKELSDQILSDWWDRLWHFVKAFADFVEGALLGLALEGNHSGEELVEDDAKGPQVAGITALFHVNHFW